MEWKSTKPKKHNDLFKARFYQTGCTRNSRIQFKKSFRTKRDYREWFDRFLRSDDCRNEFLQSKGLPVEADWLKARKKLAEDEERRCVLFGTLYQYWRDNATVDMSPSTILSFDRYWKELKGILATRPLSEIDNVFMTKIDAGLRKRGNSRSTVNRKIIFIRMVLNFNVENGLISHNPVLTFKCAKAPEPKIQFWSEEEASSFLRFAAEKYPVGHLHRQRFVAYLVALNTGVRAGELWALKPKCIVSFDQLEITEQFDLVTQTFRVTKGKQGRRVPLNSEVALALKDLRRPARTGANGLFFTNEVGGPVSHYNFDKRVFKRDIKEWGGREIKFHGLRHTAATLMIANGIPVPTVQQILGHQAVETTMGYVHALASGVADAAKSFVVAPKADALRAGDSDSVRPDSATRVAPVWPESEIRPSTRVH